MVARRKCSFGNHVIDESTRVEHGRKGCDPECARHNAFISSANINLLAQFIVFCKSKKINQHKEVAQEINVICNDQEKAQGESIGFREKLNMYFGEHLPTNVIDELCKLVQENSYGKCNFCMMPTESLILSVLQILLDAAQSAKELKENRSAPRSSIPNIRVNENNKSVASIEKEARHSSVNKDCPQQFNSCSAQENFKASKSTRSIHHECIGDPKKNCNASREASDFLDGNLMKNPFLVLDTPLVMHQGNCRFDEFASRLDDVPIMNKKAKTEGPTNHRNNQGAKLIEDTSVVKELSVHHKVSPDVEILGTTRFRERCFQLGKLTDELHNKRTFTTKPLRPVNADCSDGKIGTNRPQIHITSGHQFSITDEERGYYNIICGLAHSQWRCFKAVEFSKTSVTYSSLGESVGGELTIFSSLECVVNFLRMNTLDNLRNISSIQKSGVVSILTTAHMTSTQFKILFLEPIQLTNCICLTSVASQLSYISIGLCSSSI